MPEITVETLGSSAQAIDRDTRDAGNPALAQKEEVITLGNVNTESKCNISEPGSDYDPNPLMRENFFVALSSAPQRTLETPDKECCRICHDRSLSEPNISPCRCRGTMGQVHRSCLEQWLTISDSGKCEICGFQFTLYRQPKYNYFKAIMIWLTIEETREERLFIVSDSIRFLSVLPMVLFANHQAITLLEMLQIEEIYTKDICFTLLQPNIILKEITLAAASFLTSLIVGTVSFIDFFYFNLVFQRLQRRCSEWFKWYRTQCIIELILPEIN